MAQDDAHDRFMRLFIHHQPRLYAYIRAVVVCDADAEDALQETASVLWRKFEQYTEGTHFDRWAMTTARRVIQSLRRKTGGVRRSVAFCDEVLDRLADAMTADSTEHAAYVAALDHCVGRLGGDDRDLIRRRYQQGETGRDIAARLSVSESSVSRTLNRVYGQLMKCIERTVERSATP